MVISSRQTYKDENDKTQPAIKWLLDVMTRDGSGHQAEKVFRIENDQVLAMLGLEARPGGYRYAIDEFARKDRPDPRQGQCGADEASNPTAAISFSTRSSSWPGIWNCTAQIASPAKVR